MAGLGRASVARGIDGCRRVEMSGLLAGRLPVCDNIESGHSEKYRKGGGVCNI